MPTIDPRLAERRKDVAEDRARRNVQRLLRLIVVLGVVAAIVWLFLSPTLSVSTLEVEGVNQSDTARLLEDAHLVEGRPLILIRTGEIEDILLADPWVRSADVDIGWPNSVVVTVEERVPVAWVESGGGWARRAVDAVELPGVEGPDETMAHVILPDVSEPEVSEAPVVLGALEFVAALPPSVSQRIEIEERGGELWASIDGFEVRLGRPAEMAAKALTLAALLDQELVAGSEINLIAPTNPAVVAPNAQPAP